MLLNYSNNMFHPLKSEIKTKLKQPHPIRCHFGGTVSTQMIQNTFKSNQSPDTQCMVLYGILFFIYTQNYPNVGIYTLKCIRSRKNIYIYIYLHHIECLGSFCNRTIHRGPQLLECFTSLQRSVFETLTATRLTMKVRAIGKDYPQGSTVTGVKDDQYTQETDTNPREIQG